MTPKQRLLNSLEELENLEEGWDGMYAQQIHKESIKYITEIIKHGEERYLGLWHIWPELNGSITMTLKSKEVLGAINISKENYFWFVRDDIERFSEKNCTNWKNLVTIFNKISENFS